MAWLRTTLFLAALASIPAGRWGICSVAHAQNPLNMENVGTADFNNDGLLDILWYDGTTGELQVSTLSGELRIGARVPTIPACAASSPEQCGDWVVRGTADFNGDGRPDILWLHKPSGQLHVWFMNDVERSGSAYIAGTPISDQNWQVTGTGDFDRDGRVDLLWRHEVSGQLAVWFMNGVTLRTGSLTTPESPGDVNWRVVATGDFNGDGQVDIVWRHRYSGQIAVWYMDGIVLSSGTFTNPSVFCSSNGPSDSNWKLVGTGDFNRDGRMDIIWHGPFDGSDPCGAAHAPTGQDVIWFMRGPEQSGLGRVLEPWE